MIGGFGQAQQNKVNGMGGMNNMGSMAGMGSAQKTQ
jgi:hypothetical protein